jgi:hypothetical protein
MANRIPTIFMYHPRSVLGSYVADVQFAPAARRDAEPEPERPSRWERLKSRLGVPLLHEEPILAS